VDVALRNGWRLDIDKLAVNSKYISYNQAIQKSKKKAAEATFFYLPAKKLKIS
jgi:hypothetical protein